MNEKILIRHAGRTLSLWQWAAELGVPPGTAWHRWRRGERKFAALFGPGRKARRPIACRGRTQSVSAWAREIGMSRERLRQRLQKYPPAVALGFQAAPPFPPPRGIEHAGRTQSVSAWARELGITPSALRQRLAKHPADIALSLGRYRR